MIETGVWDTRGDERAAFKALRRENKDVWSRLASIVHDAQYVDDVRAACYPLPLIANLRCGAWYADPAQVASTSYFKSTDGHMHQWDFSLKRANLHLVDVIQSGDENALSGCILIDSTRRGKRFPDALSKTVPIWCAVLNRASRQVHGTPSMIPPLATPNSVAPSEASQIDARLAAWVDKLCASDLAVPRLVKPLCPLFVQNPDIPVLSSDACHHIVLVSVSSSMPPLTFHTPHASYVQGAGDDHEAWAHGLTPALFWRFHKELMSPSLSRDERIQRIVDFVHDEREQAGSVAWMGKTDAAIQIHGTPLYLCACAPSHVFSHDELAHYALIVHASQAPSETVPIIALNLDTSKRSLPAFSQALPQVVDAVTDALAKGDGRILLCCTDGIQLSGALAVAVLAASFDHNRHFLGAGDNAQSRLTHHRMRVSKDDTQRRMQWISGSGLHGAPSRALLQRVNAFLMGPSRQVTVWPK